MPRPASVTVLLLLLLGAVPAGAAIVVADCGTSPSGPCSCHAAPLTLPEADAMAGAPRPAPDALLILTGAGVGAGAEVETGPAARWSGDAALCAGPPAPPLPQSGLWDGAPALAAVTGGDACALAGGAAVAMTGAIGAPVPLDWRGRFDPALWHEAANPGPDDDAPVWTEEAPGRVTGAGGGAGFRTAYTAVLLTPDQFRVMTTVEGAGCGFVIVTDMRRMGDLPGG